MKFKDKRNRKSKHEQEKVEKVKNNEEMIIYAK